MNKQKKKKGISAQDLIGVKTFSDYGLVTTKGELIFYQVAPTNISVLSTASIESKIRRLMYVLTAIPDIEITCVDSSECFDANKAYLLERKDSEPNAKVKKLIRRDILFLDEIQLEMTTARQFIFTVRCRNMKPNQVFERANSVQKIIAEQGFDCHRLKKDEIKKTLAIYFDASLQGEHMPDYDGSQYYDMTKLRQEEENYD